MVKKESVPERAVTQKDVAQRASVTTSSVSYVINNGPRSVSAETRARVLKAIEELGYRPNEHAQKLMRKHWGSDGPPRQFGVVMNGSRVMMTRQYYSAMIIGLYDEAVRQNYTLRFLHTYDELKHSVLFNEHIHPDVIAGVIVLHVLPLQPDEQIVLERIGERIGNIVALDRSFSRTPSIMFDKLGAGRIATEHLLALGHRRIGFIGDIDQRFDGYLQSLRQYDVAFDHAVVPFYVNHQQVDLVRNSPEGGLRGMSQLLHTGSPPSAVFAASDEVAIGVLRAAREHGLRVPEDLSIVSVDDIELASYMSPPLTTVRVPRQEMAHLAVRTMTEHALEQADMAVNYLLPADLVVRSSTSRYEPT